MNTDVPAWKISIELLKKQLALKEIAKPPFEDKESVNFFRSARGDLALELPRGSRPVSGAKFWLTYEPKPSSSILVDKKAAGEGRNNKLEGSTLGPQYPAWTILVRDTNPKKLSLIESIIFDFKGVSPISDTKLIPAATFNQQILSNGITHGASDIGEPPTRQEVTTYRILRDTALSKRVKILHNFKCQICDHTIFFPMDPDMRKLITYNRWANHTTVRTQRRI